MSGSGENREKLKNGGTDAQTVNQRKLIKFNLINPIFYQFIMLVSSG